MTRARNPRFAPETLERKLSPSGLLPVATAEVAPYAAPQPAEQGLSAYAWSATQAPDSTAATETTSAVTCAPSSYNSAFAMPSFSFTLAVTPSYVPTYAPSSSAGSAMACMVSGAHSYDDPEPLPPSQPGSPEYLPPDYPTSPLVPL